MVADTIRADVKRYLLSGDKSKAETLKGLLSALQYAEVELRSKGQAMGDDQAITVLNKEARKREETAAIYKTAGEQARYEQEQAELELIKQYLPKQISDAELAKAVKDAISKVGASGMADMGKVIAEARKNLLSSTDGSRIAAAAKAELENK